MSNRIERKTAIPVADALQLFLKMNGMSSEHNCYRVFKAWDEASGAAKYTMRKFYRDGTLYITVNSSVVRTHLQMQADALVKKINAVLEQDELFMPEEKVSFVKKLTIK